MGTKWTPSGYQVNVGVKQFMTLPSYSRIGYQEEGGYRVGTKWVPRALQVTSVVDYFHLLEKVGDKLVEFDYILGFDHMENFVDKLPELVKFLFLELYFPPHVFVYYIL